jgi:DUF1365 family protein
MSYNPTPDDLQAMLIHGIGSLAQQLRESISATGLSWHNREWLERESGELMAVLCGAENMYAAKHNYVLPLERARH